MISMGKYTVFFPYNFCIFLLYTVISFALVIQTPGGIIFAMTNCCNMFMKLRVENIDPVKEQTTVIIGKIFKCCNFYLYLNNKI